MKRKAIIGFLNVLAGVMLVAPLVPPHSLAQSRLGQVVSSGQAQSRSGTVKAQGPLRSETRKTPPDQPPIKRPQRPEDFIRLNPPVDLSVRPEDIRPTNPPTAVNIVPDALRETPERKAAAPQAPGTFTFFRNTGLASAPVIGTPPMTVTLNSYIPIEPSAAANGRVVFYTTNSYAGVSGDGGQSFSYLNPFDNFPPDGTNDPVDGGFGGDQYVYYEPTRGLMLWLLQYNPDNNTNRQRLAVARTQSDVLNNNWVFSFYDFTPATLGFTTPPMGASGFHLDFPDVAVSDNFLYLTSNVFQRVLPSPGPPPSGNNCQACPNQNCPATCPSGCTSNCTNVFVGAVISRISLNDLAQGLTTLNFNSFNDGNFTYRCTQGAHGTMYWGSHITTTLIRIYRWAENSNDINWDDVTHGAFNTGAMTATSPDGTNFAGTADSRILGAYVANGVIGFMWNAAQSTPPATAFPFPHVWVSRFNENNRTLIDDGQVFNNVQAFLYPSVQVNDRGHLGGTMAWGGGTANPPSIRFPNALAWIADDFNNGTITPLETVTFAVGNAGPCDPAFDPIPNMTLDCYNRWGDYFAARVHRPSGLTWIGTGFVLNGANGVTRDPHYVWFGRERDTPSATNTINVDRANTSRYQDGSSAHPYRTVTDGHFATMPGDTLIIRAGDYFENPRLNRAVTVRNEGGVVKIITLP